MGKIVIPKNSASLEEVMGAIQIYYDAGDWLSNADFIQTYKNRIGIIGDDTDSSAYTKKTEIGCYYGFLEWEDITRKQSPRRITPRGRVFLEHYNANDKDAVFEDIMRSLEEVTFGRNNFACQSCDSDIEPPALFLRAMLDLGYLTNTEFAFLVYRMEYEGYHYTETIGEIRRLRENEEKIELPDEAKKFSDPKPIVIMERWGVLTSVEKGRAISKEFLEKYKNRLKNLKIYNIDMNIGVISEKTPKEVFTPEWFKEKAKDYPTFDVEANAYREKFLEKYSIEKIEALSGIDILTTIFLNNKTTDNLCCELEYNKDCKEIFGSIRSGYSTKYGLYYSKKKASWVSGPSSKQEFISEEDAITKGTELRDYLIAGAKALMAWSDFNTEGAYARLHETLKNATGGNVDRIWFLKYYQMIRPEVLPTIYSDAALGRALSLLSLTPNESSIGKMGQIKLFVDKCGISNVLFGKILWDNYPSGEEDSSAEVIEDPDDNEKRFRDWMSRQVSASGSICTPSMISANSSALKRVCGMMDIIEYPDLENLFCVTTIDTFLDIKIIIRSHHDFEEVNKACGNGFLKSALNWYEKYLNEILTKNGLEEEIDDDIDRYSKNDFLEKVFLTDQEYEKLYRLLMYKKNIILQGAPGVGKTFLAKRLAYSIIGAKDNRFVEVIQFHQSYSYEDFIMGYKPTDEIFELKTGIFYNFCKKAENDQNISTSSLSMRLTAVI